VRTLQRFSATALCILSLAHLGCGHSDEELEGKQREVDRISAELKTAKGQLEQDQAKYNEAQGELEKMRDQLKTAGVGLERSKEDASTLRNALADYKLRADRLAAIESRFKELRSKLEKLNQIGLKVVVRNNRMVIQLPGDILFDSGKDELRAQGKDALGQVADIIRSDKDLNARHFLVAGHTDNAPYGGGPFKDNWGLSLARARQVLLFLVAPTGVAAAPAATAAGAQAAADKAKKASGGGLNPVNWGASGFGEVDPLPGTSTPQSKDDMQKNRRVELIVQPNVEEMLNLNAIK
jgi:chemotaxis protein MotB